jgi:hypothetical protein
VRVQLCVCILHWSKIYIGENICEFVVTSMLDIRLMQFGDL